MVHIPQQDRSITTREKIIDASYQLFAENGYYNTNTAKIAKQAGVSTGIVYSYFHDKRDLLLEVMQRYINEVYLPIAKIIDEYDHTQGIRQLALHVVDMAITTHNDYAKIHEALHSMTCTDEIIREKFLAMENDINHKVAVKLEHIGVSQQNLTEKVHVAINLVQSLAHEYTYDKHDYINYPQLKEQVISLLTQMFE